MKKKKPCASNHKPSLSNYAKLYVKKCAQNCLEYNFFYTQTVLLHVLLCFICIDLVTCIS